MPSPCCGKKMKKVQAVMAADPEEVLGCNTRADLAAVDAVFRRRKRADLMDAGVTMELPETVLIDPEVTAGADTRIEPCVQLLGRTRIGAGCTIRTGSVLTDAVLEDNVLVKPYSIVTASHLSRGTQVGPFAHIFRKRASGRKRACGEFRGSEKERPRRRRQGYAFDVSGDAHAGSGTNIGAGTITCNYDGVEKHPTTIGKRVFIGSDTALVAPVRVGDGAYVGAGSTITENVPADALGLREDAV